MGSHNIGCGLGLEYFVLAKNFEARSFVRLTSFSLFIGFITFRFFSSLYVKSKFLFLKTRIHFQVLEINRKLLYLNVLLLIEEVKSSNGHHMSDLCNRVADLQFFNVTLLLYTVKFKFFFSPSRLVI